MTVFRDKSRWWALTLLLGSLLAGPANAQQSTGEPLRLLPPVGSQTPPEPPGSTVTVDTLPPLDGAAMGVLGPTQGGFGSTAWRAARRNEVAALLDGLPVGAPSTAMSDLMRRLLLTAAAPPEGPPNDPSILGLRAARLRDLGLAEDLLALVRAGPLLREDEAASRALIESLVLAGRDDEACTEIAPLLSRHQGVFWQRALIFCQAVGGNDATAGLGLDLLGETDAADPVFESLVEAVIAGAAPDPLDGRWARGRVADALMVALMERAGSAVPAVSQIRDPGRLAAVAENDANPSAVRVDAGERATAGGAITAGRLAALYGQVPLDPVRPGDLFDLALEMEGPLARAHLMQAARRTGDATMRFNLYELALGLSRAEGAPLGVVLALLDPLTPVPEALPVAAEAARAYYATGDLDRALAWHELAAGGDTAGTRVELSRLWPLAVLAGALDREPGRRGPVAHARNLAEWMDAEFAVSGEAGTYSAAMTLAAFSALGQPLEQAVWQRVRIDDARDTASLPSAGIWWRLPAAAQDGEIGMVVLMSLVAIGEGGPAQVSPALLERVLSAMVASGLPADARRLAREAIWATQL